LKNSAGLSMKTLIVNSYRNDIEQKINRVIEVVQKFSSFQVVNDVGLFDPERFIDYDAIVLSGSGDLLSRGAYSKTYIGFLRHNTIPCLGICYGHQMLAQAFGGKIFCGLRRIEYNETVRIIKNNRLFKDLPSEISVVESHIEHVDLSSLSIAGFEVLANSASCDVESIKHIEHYFYGVQFHPERSGVVGETIFKNFFDVVREKKSYK